MTANAMLGDREMCLEAGMDDYVSKPIRVEELVRVLSRCHAKPTSLPDPQVAPVIDLKVFEELREMVNQDQVFVEVIDRYLEDSPQLLTALSEAVAIAEIETIQRAAHTLKSTSMMFGATYLAQLCQEIESGADALPTRNTAIATLKIEYEKVQATLQQQRQQLSFLSTSD